MRQTGLILYSILTMTVMSFSQPGSYQNYVTFKIIDGVKESDCKGVTYSIDFRDSLKLDSNAYKSYPTTCGVFFEGSFYHTIIPTIIVIRSNSQSVNDSMRLTIVLPYHDMDNHLFIDSLPFIAGSFRLYRSMFQYKEDELDQFKKYRDRYFNLIYLEVARERTNEHGNIVIEDYYDWDKKTKQTEGEMKNGKAEGLWTSWWQNGYKLSEGRYVNGQRDGQWRSWYYSNGKISSEVNYTNGILNGPLVTWYENGQLHYKVTWDNGTIPEGEIRIMYDDKGNIKENMIYKDSRFQPILSEKQEAFKPSDISQKCDTVKYSSDSSYCTCEKGWRKWVYQDGVLVERFKFNLTTISYYDGVKKRRRSRDIKLIWWLIPDDISYDTLGRIVSKGYTKSSTPFFTSTGRSWRFEYHENGKMSMKELQVGSYGSHNTTRKYKKITSF
ncbi:MAG: hypothetical protein COA57_15995 [Flavobacteriales bacterium]|nr:MAG: hypothetical protein COA57_15995 [Flavobacteriales bacterium]